MSNPKLLREFNRIVNEFSKCTQIQLTGNLNIQSSQGRQWTFYYRLGKIVWATGGMHTYRRLRRCIAQISPQININNIQIDLKELSKDYGDYQILEILYKKQGVKQEQINAIVEKIKELNKNKLTLLWKRL